MVKASLKYQWVSEISKFSDLKGILIDTPSSIASYQKNKINKLQKEIKKLDKVKERKKVKELRKEIKELELIIESKFNEQFEQPYDLIVLNYEALLDDTIRNKLHSIDIDYIFADEVHMIGSPKSKRSKAMHEFDAAVKVGATATPITNNPVNIYSIFKFIEPSLFESWSKFENRFVRYSCYGRIAGAKNEADLSKLIRPYIMIKTKEEISSQLPKLNIIKRYIKMTDSQLEVDNMLREKLDELTEQDFMLRSKCKNEAEVRKNPKIQKLGEEILAIQTYRIKLAISPLLLDESESKIARSISPKDKTSPKLDVLLDLLEEIISSGEKVTIFSRFIESQKLLTDVINKKFNSRKNDNNIIKIAYVNGSIKSEQRNIEVYKKFRDDDSYKILLLSNAGAEGLNLSKCKYLIELDLADSYAVQTQRHGRLERADSVHESVTVYQLICEESWDEVLLKIIAKKENYDSKIVQGRAEEEEC